MYIPCQAVLDVVQALCAGDESAYLAYKKFFGSCDMTWLGALPASGSRLIKLLASFYRGEYESQLGSWLRASKTASDAMKDPNGGGGARALV